MAVYMKGRHLVSLDQWTSEEIQQTIDHGIQLKMRYYAGDRPELTKNKVMGLIFMKPSLRTRVSFESLMIQTGGRALYLGPDDIKIGKRETTEDISIVLSSMVDVIMARVFEHKIIEDLAKYSRVPVINGLSDYTHPCQALADYMTIQEKLGSVKGKKVTYIGDGNNVAHSLMFCGAKLGCDVTICCPEGYSPAEKAMKASLEIADLTGSKIVVEHDVRAAFENADVIYTDVWASMGQEAEAEARKKIFMPYQVDMAKMAMAKPNVLFMHCLPAHYDEEVTYEVAQSRHSVIYDQAENRLHAQKAVVVNVIQN